MRSDEIHPGDIIAGKYRVRTILGRTHGLLVEAFHTEFDQQVIIKILPGGYGDEKEIERFRREARTLAKLESEHVARIIDVGSQDDGTFYLVRQHLEGVDLGSYLQQSGPLPLPNAVLLILQAAEAVAETHSHGIILRELCPSHLFLTQRVGGAPLIKIVDFGTAKLMRDAAAPTAGGDLTATAMFGLSPYSSPELVRKAKNVDVRTDVWSLGAILYQLLTARPPFNGEMAMLMLQITKEEPVPATQYRQDLPHEIDQILGWCMAKDVDGRFRNVHAFAHALTPYAPTEGQVLIERIGAITHAAKTRKRVAPAAPGQVYKASPPPGKPRGEDTLTNVKAGMAAKPSMGATQPLNQFAGAGPSPSTQPFPAAPSSRGPASSRQGSSRGPASNRSPTRIDNGALPATSSTVQPPLRAVPPPQRRDRRLLYGVLAAAAVLVPMLTTIFLLTRQSKQEQEQVTAETASPIQVPVSTTSAAATSETVASAAPTATATAEPTATATATAAPTQTVASNKTRTPPRTSRTPPKQQDPEPEPPKQPETSGGGTGQIIAVANGGTCAFSINGASKGTSSSITVSVPPGTYSVTCRPASGATKSKSVVVKSGKPAFAAFKL